ncbi:MAG TPA: N-acetylmuramoyl-L-alanine amidase, partial [Proteobacteria bacterium]|nr:N-acetylmuramoyl-L-alanine amidase [Pseudomonadota bacterium]
MSGPADWVDGKLVVPIYLALLTLPSRFPPGEIPLLPPPPEGVRIMLDPGHGGIDPGAISENGLREKDVVLEITRKVKDLLEIKGYGVFLTR